MSKPMLILVAGAYRSGTDDNSEKMRANLDVLEQAALQLFRLGHIPMIGEWVALPLLKVAGSTQVGDALYEEIVYPAAKRLLEHTQAVLRLPSASKGADNDVKIALGRGIPVYYQLEDVPTLE